MSRVIPAAADLVAAIRRLGQRVGMLERAGVPVDPVMFAVADLTRGAPCTSAEFTGTHVGGMFRSRRGALWSWVVISAGAGSVVEARFRVDAGGFEGVEGPAVATPAGGVRWLLVTVRIPDEWPTGTPMTVTLQARRVSGGDATTIQPTTTWTT